MNMATVHGGGTPKVPSLENTELHNPGCLLEKQNEHLQGCEFLQVDQRKAWNLSFPGTGSFCRSLLGAPC